MVGSLPCINVEMYYIKTSVRLSCFSEALSLFILLCQLYFQTCTFFSTKINSGRKDGWMGNSVKSDLDNVRNSQLLNQMTKKKKYFKPGLHKTAAMCKLPICLHWALDQALEIPAIFQLFLIVANFGNTAWLENRGCIPHAPGLAFSLL